MLSPIKKYIMLSLGVGLCLSFQSCDQVKKFVDYLSPAGSPPSVKVEKQETQKPVAEEPQQQSAQPRETVKKESTPKELAPDVLVQVGDWVMTASEFNEQINALEGMEGFDPSNVDQKKYILSQLLQQQILAQEALRRNLDKTDEVVEALKDVRNTILVQALVAKETESIAVSDEDVKAFYDANPQEFTMPLQWHVLEVVVATEEEAKQLLVDLNQGAPFDVVAKERSIGKTAKEGGSLGFLYAIPDVEVDPDAPIFPFKKMEQVVAGLDVGSVSGAFAGPQGYYIVKLVDRQGGEIQKLEEIQEELKTYMVSMEQQNVLYKLLEEAESHLEININEKLLEE